MQINLFWVRCSYHLAMFAYSYHFSCLESSPVTGKNAFYDRTLYIGIIWHGECADNRAQNRYVGVAWAMFVELTFLSCPPETDFLNKKREYIR